MKINICEWNVRKIMEKYEEKVERKWRAKCRSNMMFCWLERFVSNGSNIFNINSLCVKKKFFLIEWKNEGFQVKARQIFDVSQMCRASRQWRIFLNVIDEWPHAGSFYPIFARNKNLLCFFAPSPSNRKLIENAKEKLSEIYTYVYIYI